MDVFTEDMKMRPEMAGQFITLRVKVGYPGSRVSDLAFHPICIVPVANDLIKQAMEQAENHSRIFDLLEALKPAYPDIAGGFARATGGVDMDYILDVIRRDNQPKRNYPDEGLKDPLEEFENSINEQVRNLFDRLVSKNITI